MMKKLILLTLAVTLCVALSGCFEQPPLATDEPPTDDFPTVTSDEPPTEPPATLRPLTEQERETKEVSELIEREISLTGSWFNVISSVGELEAFTSLKPWEHLQPSWDRYTDIVIPQNEEEHWLARIAPYDDVFFAERYMAIVEHSIEFGSFSEVLRVNESGDIVICDFNLSNVTMNETLFHFVEFDNDFASDSLKLAYVSISRHHGITHRDSDGRRTVFDTPDEAIAAGILTREELDRLLPDV